MPSICSECCSRIRSCPKPQGFLASVITKGLLAVLLFGVCWAVLQKECQPGHNIFGLVILFLSAVCGGKLVGAITLPNLPPIPPLLGMLLMGLVLRNVPYVEKAVFIDQKWSSSLRSIALAIILTRAGLGLNPAALRKLKMVCLRVAVIPCTVEACTVAVVSHFLMGLPWIWGFILGFVLAAVSPAVVVPSMLLLQAEGFGVQKGIPSLLMASGSFDDILAITGFTTCLGMAFGTGSTWGSLAKGLLEVVVGILAGGILGVLIHFFPSEDQVDLVLRRSCMLLGLSVFSVFVSHVAGLGGAGGLSTLVLSFIAGISWGKNKAPVAAVVGRFWDVFQPLLFGLIGAEITISTLNANTVGLGAAALCIGVVVRVCVTFTVVLFAGFNLKEKIFIALAWLPKATVQAAIGSTALDMARNEEDEQLERYGMDVLTVAVLSIMITAPIGALAIGLAGPKLLQKYTEIEEINTQGTQDKTGDISPPELHKQTPQDLESKL
ncbi:sodium/hydrogen exchanger 9B2 isoform X2 [Neoarius graeffei]|uniref:sodium/hydrogen exchanger 9B2 isoform X2 n=1 Tax=Neoarius graeffei TaxID=443677 RepID=UPI00298D39A7|nr:sodium/hydrogen exchanger 9B2 isoform X2 [Neoarius graeffei]